MSKCEICSPFKMKLIIIYKGWPGFLFLQSSYSWVKGSLKDFGLKRHNKYNFKMCKNHESSYPVQWWTFRNQLGIWKQWKWKTENGFLSFTTALIIIIYNLIKNSKTVKKMCGPFKKAARKSCKIKGGGPEVARLAPKFIWIVITLFAIILTRAITVTHLWF